MPKVIAKKKAEEKKKSSASSQSAFEQAQQIYNQQRQEDIAEVKRLQNALNAQQSKANQMDTLSGAQQYYTTVEAYRQRLAELGRNYGYNVTDAVRSIGTGAGQVSSALQGMSQADYLQQIRYPQKYANMGRAGVTDALERLRQRVEAQTGKSRTPSAADVRDLARQALSGNRVVTTGVSGTAKAEYNWLKQHQYEFWSEDELRKAIAEADKRTAAANQVTRSGASPWGDATLTQAQQAERYMAQQKTVSDSGAKEAERMRAALRPKAYASAIAKLPESLRRDVLEYSGQWQEEARGGVNNWQYEDGTNRAGKSQSSQKLENLRKSLKQHGLTEEQISSLLDYGTREYNARKQAQTVQGMSEYAKEHPVLASAGSVATNLLGGGIGFADMLLQRVRSEEDAYTGGKRPIDYNSGAQTLSNVSSAVRGTVGEMASSGKLGDFGGFLYQTGMSIADSGVSALTGRILGVPNLAEALLSGSAAQQAAQDAHRRGATDRQALWSGFTAGTAEALFEHLSLENLRSIREIAAAGQLGGKAFWKAAGVQALTEASEEGFTSLANTITDAIIMGDQNQISRQIQTNLLNGMSERDAIKSAWTDWIGQVAMDAAGGLISGGVMGTSTGGVGLAQNRIAERRLDKAIGRLQGAQNADWSKYGAQAKSVETVYNLNPSVDVETFQRQFDTAYDLGKSGAEVQTAMETTATADLSPEQRRNAWLIGRDTGIREGTIKEEATEHGEAVRVRGSGERDAGAGSAGSVQQMEGSTGSFAEGRQIGVGEGAADSAAAGLRYSEQKVSARDLGVDNGAVIENLRVVDESSYTPEMKQFAEEQAAQGHKVTYVSGFIHAQDGPGGNVTKARGMVNRNGDIFVQVDHARFTAMQIARHEDTHTKIRRGEIDLGKAKESVKRTLGEEAYQRAVQDYAEAYAGIDMAEDEIWEEIVCDAEGGMNIFEGTRLKREYARNAEITGAARQAVRGTERRSEAGTETKAERRAEESPPETAEPEPEKPPAAAKPETEAATAETTDDEAPPVFDLEYDLDEIENPDNLKTDTDTARKAMAIIDQLQSAKRRGFPSVRSVERALRKNGIDAEVLRDLERAGFLVIDSEGVFSYGAKFSRELDDRYMKAVQSGDMEAAQRMVDEAAKASGYPVRAYHQTGADFTEFSTDHPVAGRNDSETPNGIFFKMNDHDIGLEGKKQMGVYLKTGRMLHFKNREQANAWYQKNIDGYRALQNEMRAKLKPFDDELERIERLMFSEETDDDRYAELDAQWNDKLEEMRVVEDDYRGRLRELLNDYFLNNDSGYDSIKLDYDGHRYVDGKRENVETIILFDGRDVKSADPVTYDDDGNVIPLSERFDPENRDIRFSKESDTLETLAKENQALRKETAELVKQVAKWKGETKRTTRLTLREQDLRREARAMLKAYNSTTKAEEILPKLQQLGELILNGENGEQAHWDDIHALAEDIADDIVGGEQVNIRGDVFNEYQQIRDYVAGKTLYLPAESIGDLQGFENMAEFNRRSRGQFTLTKDKAKADVAVEDAYYEMAEVMPGWFPADVNSEAEMAQRMLEVLEGLKPVYGMSDETSYHYDEAVAWAASDVIDRLLDESVRQNPKTFADRAQAKLERTVAQERRRADARVEKARQTGERRLERQRDRFEQRIKRVREQGEAKLERTKRQYAERSQRAMDRMRERQERQIQRLKDKQKQKERNARDRRDTTHYWQQIQRLGAQFRQMADKPTQAASKHAPRGLASALAELAEQFRTENRKRASVTLNDQLLRLKNAYDEISEESSPDHMYYNTGVDYMIQQVMQDVTDVTTTDMTLEQLERVHQLLQAAHHTITNANKFVHGQWLMDKIEAGRKWASEIMNASPLLKKGIGGRLLNLQLRPDSFFARISGFAKNSVGEQIQKMFVEGEERMLRIQQDGYNHFREFTESKEFDKLSSHKQKDLVDVGLKDQDGNAVLLTRDMMLAVYMHLRANDNLMGAAYGGFDIPAAAQYYRGSTAESYEDGVRTASINLEVYELQKEERQIRKRIAEAKAAGEAESMDDLARLDEIEAEIQSLEGEMIGTLLDVRENISKQLTDYEKRLIEAADAWMQKSADYINEETRAMYGIEKANVEHYWPIHRNTDFVNTDLVNAVNEVNLENWGSLKERVKNRDPIKLTGFGFEIDNHTQKMSQFCGFAAVQRDFQQIYSTRLPGMHTTLAEQINKKFGGDMKKAGTSAKAYIQKYVNDISGAKSGDKRSPLAPIRQNLARATLSVNFRVAVSQVASIPTAASEVGWGAMAKGWARSSVKGLSAKQQAKLAEADPWFWQRSRGEGGMREFAEMRESNNALDRVYNKIAGTKVGKAVLNWCQRFDMYATYTQWTMAEEWVKKHTDLRPDTAEYDSAVSAKYRDIIRKTQPNYTVTERSDLLRDSRESMKWATMYKTQSNQNLNILYEATARLHQYSRDFKAGKNGVTEADLKEARAAFANAYTGVILGGTVSFVLFRAVANALIHTMNGYRDDDDEITLQSLLGGLMKETFSAISGMFVLGSEIYDIVYALISKDKYWGLTDSAIGAIDDIFSKAVKMATSDDPPSRDDWVKLSNSIMAVLGIPGKNAAQIANGVWNHIEDIQNGEFLSFEAGVNRTASMETNRILNSYLKGEGDKLKKEWDELVELKDGDEGKAQETMRDAIKEAYMDGKITDKQVMDMLKRYGGKDGDDGKEYLLKWKSVRETGIAVDDIKDAYLDGDLTRAEVVSMRTKYMGDTPDEAEEYALKLDCEKKYGVAYGEESIIDAAVGGEIDVETARKIWSEYGGIEGNDLENRITKLQFVVEHPGASYEDVSIKAIKGYNDYGKAAQMDADAYMSYFAQMDTYTSDYDANGKTIKGQGKMNKVFAYLSSLDLPPEQKTALALSMYAQSTVAKNKTW